MIKAVTAIWKIKDRLDNAIKYVENNEKTIQKVVNYMSDEGKTDDKKYATYLNCNADDPYQSMMNTKKLFDDHRPIVAYHGYQSFKAGEVTADVAHEIGVKLAKELYANRFEVIVTTHLDKDHIHNHILLNATSFLDGKRFCNMKKDYRMMRDTSDRLCKEYGLSIIENPQNRTKKVNYHALKSYMNDVKKDIDALASQAPMPKYFWDSLHKKGYVLDKIEDEYVIFHPFCSEPIYLKSLGEKYHVDNIESRLSDKYTPQQDIEHIQSYYRCREFYKLYRRKQLPKLAELHVAYLIQIDILPNPKQKLSKEARQALRKMDQYSREIELLAKNKIEDIVQLDSYQDQQQNELNKLLKERKDCYYQRQKSNTVEEKEQWSTTAKLFTPQIKKLRLEIKACDNIRNRSFDDELEKNAWKKMKQRETR